MKKNSYPAHIQAKLDQLTQQVEHATEQVARTKDAIAGARQRLTGGFQQDREFTDLRASLDQLVADLPVLERKLRDAQFTLADAKAWLEALPHDAVLEPVPPAQSDDDLDLQTIRQRIDDAEGEVRQLRAVPVPGDDVEKRIKAYVATLARPQVSGVAAGQQLRVSWPNDMTALLAFLHPDTMVDALTKEVVRSCNTPMSPDERKRRIAELEAQVDTLQRRALALGADLCVMPAQIVLGVRVARQTKRAA